MIDRFRSLRSIQPTGCFTHDMALCSQNSINANVHTRNADLRSLQHVRIQSTLTPKIHAQCLLGFAYFVQPNLRAAAASSWKWNSSANSTKTSTGWRVAIRRSLLPRIFGYLTAQVPIRNSSSDKSKAPRPKPAQIPQGNFGWEREFSAKPQGVFSESIGCRWLTGQ